MKMTPYYSPCPPSRRAPLSYPSMPLQQRSETHEHSNYYGSEESKRTSHQDYYPRQQRPTYLMPWQNQSLDRCPTPEMGPRTWNYGRTPSYHSWNQFNSHGPSRIPRPEYIDIPAPLSPASMRPERQHCNVTNPLQPTSPVLEPEQCPPSMENKEQPVPPKPSSHSKAFHNSNSGNSSGGLRDLDIVCGRGAPTAFHYGNQVFRDLVQCHQTSYLCAKRSDKPRIAMKIMDMVKSSGARFVRREKSLGRFGWVEIDSKGCYEKVCQALRDGAPDLQRQVLSAAKRKEAINKNSPSTKEDKEN